MSAEILKQLAAPFDPHVVSWRVTNTNREKTKGQAACYIDARDVQRRLDQVMGLNWSSELGTQGGLVTCRIGLYIDGQWIYRQDGTAAVREKASDAQTSAKEDQEREMSLKGAASDALKRAAVQWGIGRYLYSIDAPWVQIDQYRRIDKSEHPRLFGLLEQHYDRWHKQAGQQRPANGSNEQQPKQPAAVPNIIDGEAADAFLKEARKNADFDRIEKLLKGKGNGDTVGGINRILGAENNKAAIEGWSEEWRAVMRGIVKEALAKAKENRQQQEHMEAA